MKHDFTFSLAKILPCRYLCPAMKVIPFFFVSQTYINSSPCAQVLFPSSNHFLIGTSCQSSDMEDHVLRLFPKSSKYRGHVLCANNRETHASMFRLSCSKATLHYNMSCISCAQNNDRYGVSFFSLSILCFPKTPNRDTL